LLSASSGDVLIWPDACAQSLVERVGREIRTSRPDYGAGLGIDCGLRKASRRACFVEHWAVHPPEHIDLAGQAIGERKAPSLPR
jgi:hypothetical protein